MNDIFLVERNTYGYWVIYGSIGCRRYMGYSKRDALRMYRRETKI